LLDSKGINGFLNAVCDQVRWKRAHPAVRRELFDHIEDQRDAFLVQGLSEQESESRAIMTMGDPVEIGSQMDSAYRPRLSWGDVIPFALLILCGLLARIFIYGFSGERWLYDAAALLAGVLCFAGSFRIDLHFIAGRAWLLYGLLTASVLVMLLLGMLDIGWYVRGMRRPGAYSVYLMLLLPIAYAGIIYRLRGKGLWGVLLCGILFAVPGLLELAIPDIPNYSSVFMAAFPCLLVLTIAILTGCFGRKKPMALALTYIPAIGACACAIISQPYLAARLSTAIDPSIDPTGQGFMGTTVRGILGGAKLFGQGSVSSEYAARFVNDSTLSRTDYLLTILIHKLGWAAGAAVIALFLFIIVYALYRCVRQKSLLGKLTGAAIVSAFFVQSALYVWSNLGFTLIGWLPLPFVSYGNLSLITNAGMFGLLLSLFQTNGLFSDTAVSGHALTAAKVSLNSPGQS
jgi:cell division protein FtsW (lipid II flippase)